MGAMNAFVILDWAWEDDTEPEIQQEMAWLSNRLQEKGLI